MVCSELDDKSQSLLVVREKDEERGWIVEVVIQEVEENKKAVNGQGHTRPSLIATGGCGNRGVRVWSNLSCCSQFNLVRLQSLESNRTQRTQQ